MKCMIKLALLAAALALSACSSMRRRRIWHQQLFQLVRVQRVYVGDGQPWRSLRRGRGTGQRAVLVRRYPRGRGLDPQRAAASTGSVFVTGLQNDKYLIRQRRTANAAGAQVPVEHDAARDRGDDREPVSGCSGGAVDFRTLSLQPRPFLGTNGFQFDYEHLDSDELWREGRAVGAVIDGRLYLILLDAARSHYYRTHPAGLSKRSSPRRSCARLADRRNRRRRRLGSRALAARGRRCSGSAAGSSARQPGVGWPGWDGSGAARARLAVLRGMGGSCCMRLVSFGSINALPRQTVAGRRGLPNAAPCYRPRTFKRPRGRGGIGRRAGFRFQYRKMWGFESLRPHQSAMLGTPNSFHRERAT